jgi:uncharacterized protein (TIGR02145 family)
LGWKIPSYKDWMKLINYLGGEEVAGYKLKSSSDWVNEAMGDNSSGFNASPSSTYLDLNEGWFTAPNDFASFWTSTVNNIGGANFVTIVHIRKAKSIVINAECVIKTIAGKKYSNGYPVRCVKL